MLGGLYRALAGCRFPRERDRHQMEDRDAKGLPNMIGAVEIEREFASFVNDASFSCLVGKGVVHQHGHIVRAYPPLGTRAAASALCGGTGGVRRRRSRSDEAAGVRRGVPGRARERAGVRGAALGAAAAAARARRSRAGWDPSVSEDPDDPLFSFSFGGHALFVVGLHPQSSRLSRRFGGPRWSSIRTRSSSGCAARGNSSACSTPFASATSRSRDAQSEPGGLRRAVRGAAVFGTRHVRRRVALPVPSRAST